MNVSLNILICWGSTFIAGSLIKQESKFLTQFQQSISTKNEESDLVRVTTMNTYYVQDMLGNKYMIHSSL
jgi:hypothetical protein